MIKIFETDEDLAAVIAEEMMRQLHKIENPVFCVAAGNTPAKAYNKFIEKSLHNKALKNLKFVSLDEWVGIGKTMIGSCYQMLKEDLFRHLPLSDDQVVFFETVECSLEEECQRIDTFINNNKITFSLMGVGMNGHIGLNEPGTEVKGYSSVIPLSDKTKEVAMKYFEKNIQIEEGITLGLQQIIDSQRVIVVITGEHKKYIVKEIVENSESYLPVQELLGYTHIDLYLDKAAAELLSKECIEEFRQ